VQEVKVDPNDPDAFKVKKVADKGYCSDWRYLPEGGYPARQNAKADPVQECAKRCTKAYGKQQAFYLRDRDQTCACSKGKCRQISKSSNGYTSYTITAEPAEQVSKEANTPDPDAPEVKTEASEAVATQMLSDNKAERNFKEQEKKDMTFRKGLFRMGMKFQGLLHQLSRSDDKQMSQEIKEELSKLQKKLPKYIINVNEELEKALRN